MDDVFQSLKNEVEGEVHFDNLSKAIYSVDASIYQVEPTGIVVAKNTSDIIRSVDVAASHDLSVTARGAATGINGACIGEGLIIDTSKYITQIHEINYEEGYAICDPGVVQDQLNAALSKPTHP